MGTRWPSSSIDCYQSIKHLLHVSLSAIKGDVEERIALQKFSMPTWFAMCCGVAASKAAAKKPVL
jgi:hypothetical protein